MNNSEDKFTKPMEEDKVLKAKNSAADILEVSSTNSNAILETIEIEEGVNTLDEKSNKISIDLEALKHSFVNEVEINDKVDPFKDIKYPDIQSNFGSSNKNTEPSINKNLTNVEKIEEDTTIKVAPIVILNENGFSKPVGTFNPLTRVATLTSEIVDKILIIEINDVTLDGNNYTINNINSSLEGLITTHNLKNITIKNLNIITSGTGIGLGANNTDVTVECCVIKDSYFGLAANGARNLIFENNEISNCLYGLYLNNNCSYSTICNNTFINNSTSILISLKNSFNIIKNNTITLTKSYSNEAGIILGSYNSYNTFEKNIITFSNRTTTTNVDTVVYTSNGFSISGIANTMNLVKDNTFEFVNNTFNFNVLDIDFKILQAKIFENNSEIAFANNKFLLENNTFNINSVNSIEIRQANLFNVQTTDIEISENTFTNKNNTINYINNNKVSIKSYFINVRFDNSCHYSVVSKNKFFNLSNSINPSQVLINNPDIIFANISVNKSNVVIEIEDNIFEILNNTNFTYESGVYISQNNTGVGITRNLFKNKIISPIVLTENNYGNVITCNTFESTETAAIILSKNNNLNIIENNKLKNVEFFGIVLIENNNNNLISKNYIENGSVGILFLLANNIYNTINKNVFCKTQTLISIPSGSYNYIDENVVNCLEK